MNNSFSLEELYRLDYTAFDLTGCDPTIASWLLESQSMTRRLKHYCQQLRVEIIRGEPCGVDALVGQERFKLRAFATDQYWLREICLYGDEQPWLYGRTIVPLLDDTIEQQNIARLGNTPLGEQLFAHPELSRDFIEPGKSGALWGRCSLLRLAKQPLLLTELFLPNSPVYSSLR